MIRILIVDDQRIVREGIKILLEKKSDIQIVGDASEGKEALQKIRALQPDVLLLDINMPGIDGFTIAERIKIISPKVKIIMLSSHEDKDYVQKATEIGAKGYLLKNASSQELEWSIKLVYQGYSTIKSELLEEQFASAASKTGVDLNFESNKDRLNTAPFTVATVNKNDGKSPQKLEFILPKKALSNGHSNYPQPKQKPSRFHSVSVSRIRKTMMSAEFKLLILAILFCLGFLIFIALS